MEDSTPPCGIPSSVFSVSLRSNFIPHKNFCSLADVISFCSLVGLRPCVKRSSV